MKRSPGAGGIRNDPRTQKSDVAFAQSTTGAALAGGHRRERRHLLGRVDESPDLVADLALPVTILGQPTVREADGLAMSSRNVHLGAEARREALVLVRALDVAEKAVAGGERRTAHLLEIVRQIAQLHRRGLEITVVTSGAVLAGRERMGVTDGLP